MKTKFLMEIGFILNDNEKNKRIVCGVIADYPINELDFVHQDIMIETKTKKFLFKVKKIDLFSSLSGSFNIGFTFYDNTNFRFLHVGDKLYKIIGNT